MDTPADTGHIDLGVRHVGPRGDEPFTIPEIRAHLADLRDAHPDTPAVAEVLAIVEAMLVHHDCRRPVPSGTGVLAQVVPLRPVRD
jgi:hypothetical protein